MFGILNLIIPACKQVFTKQNMRLQHSKDIYYIYLISTGESIYNIVLSHVCLSFGPFENLDLKDNKNYKENIKLCVIISRRSFVLEIDHAPFFLLL